MGEPALFTCGASLAESFGEVVTEIDTLWNLLAKKESTSGTEVAVSSLYQGSEHLSEVIGYSSSIKCKTHLEWTYSDIERGARRLASMLQAHGVRRNGVVACFMWNSADWALLFWTAACFGATLAPLDPRMLGRPSETRHCLDMLEASVIIVEDSQCAELLETAVANGPVTVTALKMIWDTAIMQTPGGWTDISTLASKTLPTTTYSAHGLDLTPNDVALILFTSGTTSMPKGCPLTSANLSVGTNGFRDYMGIISSSRVLAHGPCFHILTLNTILGAWRAGASVVFASPRFDPALSLREISEHGCTNVSCTSGMIRLMEASKNFHPGILSSLTQLGIGGEVVTPAFLTHCEEVLFVKHVIPGYGMSEAHIVLLWRIDEKYQTRDSLVGMGKVLPGSKLRICDVDTRQIVKRSQIGELYIGGQAVIAGYLKNASPESFSRDEEGTWFRTGDLAFMDEHGVVFITGRVKDIIIRGGENISLSTIEACLDAHPSVIQSQIIGITDSVAGEVPVGIVKLLVGNHETFKQATGNVALVLCVHHSLFDAVSMSYFFQDLDLLLSASPTFPPSLPIRTPYHEWIHTHWQNRGNALAKSDIAFHVTRLRGMAQYRNAIWPPKRAPERFIGNFSGWNAACTTCGCQQSRITIDPPEKCRGSTGLIRYQTFPNFARLQSEYGITASSVVKVALALMNSKLTGAKCALFGNTDAGRRWPFLDPTITKYLPNPMNIDGPTLATSLNLIHLDRGRQVLELLKRIQEEQTQLSERIHAPPSKIAEELGAEDGPLYQDAVTSQLFSWDPTLRAREGGQAFKTLKLIRRQAFLERAVFYNCGLRDENELVIRTVYDDCQLSSKEMNHALDLVLKFVAILTDPEQWDRTLRDVLDC